MEEIIMEQRKTVEVALSQEEVEKIISDYIVNQFNLTLGTPVTVVLRKKVTLISFPE